MYTTWNSTLLAQLSDVFHENLTTLPVVASAIPACYGAQALTWGNAILVAPACFADGATLLPVLAHEAAHIVQARRSPRGEPEEDAIFINDPELESEAIEAARQAMANRSINICGRLPPRARNIRAVIQPLIVNIGDHDIPNAFISDEFRAENGWIVAKDVFTAMRHSGNMVENIIELRQCAAGLLGNAENLYLQGHGSAGALGGLTSVGVIAKYLNRLFPIGYTGEIRIYSCSAGASAVRGEDAPSFAVIESGIRQLRLQLTASNIRISAAAGIALNCPDYPNGTRVLCADPAAQGRVFAQIDRTRVPVDAAWAGYRRGVLGGVGQLPLATLRDAAEHAYIISRNFYRALANACAGDLMPIGTDIATSTSVQGRPRSVSI